MAAKITYLPTIVLITVLGGCHGSEISAVKADELGLRAAHDEKYACASPVLLSRSRGDEGWGYVWKCAPPSGFDHQNLYVSVSKFGVIGANRMRSEEHTSELK